MSGGSENAHRNFDNAPTSEVSTAPKQAEAVFCSNEDVSGGLSGIAVFGRLGKGFASMTFKSFEIAQQDSRADDRRISQCSMI